MSSSSHPTALPDPRAAIRRVININLGRYDKVVRTVYLPSITVSWSSHPTALPDPRAAIPRVIRRGSVVMKVCVVRDLDELFDRLDQLLDQLVPTLVRLVEGVVEDAVGNAMKKSMVRCVRRNPEIAVKILHGLSGNRIVKDVKGDYHLKVIMGNHEYMVYKYKMHILTEGLFNNEDPSPWTVSDFCLIPQTLRTWMLSIIGICWTVPRQNSPSLLTSFPGVHPGGMHPAPFVTIFAHTKTIRLDLRRCGVCSRALTYPYPMICSAA